MKRIKKADIIFLALCFLFSGLSGYFLLNPDFSLFSDDLSKIEVAKVFAVKMDVRLKKTNSYSWLPAYTPARLFYGDSIFTGPNSETDLQMADDSTIHLNQNTLVTFTNLGSRVQLDLRFGEIVGDFSKNSTLSIKTTQSELKALGHMVLKSSESPKSDDAKTDLPLVENKASAPALSELFIKSRYPSATEKRAPSAVEIPKITWTKVASVEQYEVELSRTEEFSATRKYQVQGNRFEWQDYRPGRWFYRVHALGSAGITGLNSETGQAKIYLEQPKIYVPESVIVRGKLEDASGTATTVKITWDDVPFSKNYRLRLQPLNHPEDIQSVDVPTTSSSFNISKPGKYLVDLQAYDEDNQPILSEIAAKKFIYIYRKWAKAPDLLEPKSNSTLFLLSLQSPDLWLEWTPVEDIDQYEVELSLDEKFSKIYYSAVVSKNRILLSRELPTGTVYWRVRSLVEKQERHSEWTKAYQFRVGNSSREKL